MKLLEREKHLALLHERLALAEHGYGQIVFLGGEAGTGKTSLIWQLAAGGSRPNAGAKRGSGGTRFA